MSVRWQWLLLGWAALTLQAASTSYWEINNYQEFLKGKLDSVSLTRDGRLTLAPRTEQVFTLDQPVIWSVARGPGKTVYLATGHRGQVFRVDAAGKSELIWTAPEPEVFTITADAKGVLYAGTAPDGKIYRIENGKATEYFQPKAKYIWSLAIGADGALYAGTGDEGRIFRITGPGKGELWYETGQTHVTALAFDGEKRLLAGTEPNGILYRVTAKDKAFVLYDANLPEIRAIVPAPDGTILVAALGGAYGKRQAGAAGAAASVQGGTMVTAPPTTITVEAAAAQGGVEIDPKTDGAKAAAPAPAAAAPVISATPMLELTGVDRSAVYRIHPDNLVETLWVSKEENIYDLAPMGDQVLFSTDAQGRVYRLEADRKATLLVETKEGEATRLVPSAEGILVATSHAAKLLRLGSEPGGKGEFESPVHDATNAARWGRLTWRGQTPGKAKLLFRTRSGNSARPDKTWSDWSDAVAQSGAPITSPNARYLQWKVELTGSGKEIPSLDGVSIAYLPQNTPPVVKSISVTTQAMPAAATGKSSASNTSPNAVYSITVSDGGDAGAATSAGNPTQTVARASNGQLVITWQAEDVDGDRMAYTVWFRGEEESQWKVLKKDWADLALTLDGDALADGKYLFRVSATDAPANPAPSARESDLVSAPFLIDNTPPAVTARARRESGGAVVIEIDARDGVSAIRRAEVSLDAGAWIPLAPVDGVADSLAEAFQHSLQAVPGGEHLVVVRVFDSAGNAGFAKVLLK
jgi:hypothetical protein